MRVDAVIPVGGGDMVEPQRHQVNITLSKRNLLALLHKVDQEYSAKRIVIFDNNTWLTVRAETDEEHYKDRAFGPGPMTPDTEAFIEERKAAA